MKDKPSKKARLIIYATTGLINLVAVYLVSKGYIGDAEQTFLNGLNVLVLGLAGLNTEWKSGE